MSLSSREQILQKIRAALRQAVPAPFPGAATSGFFSMPPHTDLVAVFTEKFTSLQGNLVRCNSATGAEAALAGLLQERGWTRVYCAEPALRAQFPSVVFSNDLPGCEVAITGCEYLVARTGSIVLNSREHSRAASVYAPVHICMAFTRQLVYDVGEVLRPYAAAPTSLPSLVTLATGPSRTADIEKTLVTGVHGPGEVYCFLSGD
jgi:L-lactate dehydrogenase complex protein LldG